MILFTNSIHFGALYIGIALLLVQKIPVAKRGTAGIEMRYIGFDGFSASKPLFVVSNHRGV
jgi:hypothetical protein